MAPEQVALASLRHPQDQRSDLAFLLTTLGKLWMAGVQVDWAGFYGRERRRRLPLPTYPFERKRHWISAGKQSYAFASVPGSFQTLGEASVSGQMHSEQVVAEQYADAPRNGVEQSVADIWQELLGIEQIGIHDNFFELGGHSLLVSQVIARLRQAFGVKLSLPSFFATPTIEELAVVIEQAKDGTTALPDRQEEEDDLEDALRLLGQI
jgi:acyl transferase domain-containing protein